MTIQTIETLVREIAARLMSNLSTETTDSTVIADSSLISAINDEACNALHINITAEEAANCRTVGDYITLAQSKR